MSRLFFYLRVLAGLMVLSEGGWCLGVEWEKEAFVLVPEVEEAWGKRMEEAKEEHRRQKRGRLEREVALLRKGKLVTEAGAEAMKREIPALIEAGMPDWEQSMRKVFRESLKGEAGPALRRIEQRITARWLGEIPGDFRKETVNGELWAGLVRKHVSEAAYEEWERERRAKLEARERETEALVVEGVKKVEVKRVLQGALSGWLGEMGVSLEAEPGGESGRVDKVWAEEVRRGFEELVVEYEKAMKEASRVWLDVCPMDGPTWTSARKKGFYFSVLPEAEWRRHGEEVLMKLVPEEAKVLYEKLVREREEWMKGVVVKARVMIVEQMVALDAGQLKAVTALAAALPIEAGEPLLNPNSDPEHWKVWKGAEGARRLNEILDDRQERMVAKGVARFEKGNSGMGSSQEVAAEVLRHPALGAEEPEAVEEVVSKYLAEDSQEHAMKGFDSIMRDVDAVVRVLGLDEGVRAELELGAKGTVQAAAEAHRVNQGRWIRAQTQGATTATIRNRLKNLGGYTFQFGNEGNTPVEDVLNEAIDEKQKEVVLAYQDAVRKRRDEAIAEVALGRLQKALGLSTEQREKLGKALVRVMGRYGPDIEMSFRGWGERMPWFLQSYYLMMPGAGVEERELKGLLNERQREIWDEQVTERGGHYWGQILEYHEQRVKSKGERQANRRILFQQ